MLRKNFIHLRLSLLLLLSQSTYAWECIPPTYNIDEKLRVANHIFIASIMKAWVEEDTYTVASVTAEGSSLKDYTYYKYFAKYELIQKIRGNAEKNGILESSQEPFRVELVPGYVYLVLLQESNETGSCEGTVRLDSWDSRALEISEGNLKEVLSAHASWPREIKENFE